MSSWRSSKKAGLHKEGVRPWLRGKQSIAPDNIKEAWPRAGGPSSAFPGSSHYPRWRFVDDLRGPAGVVSLVDKSHG